MQFNAKKKKRGAGSSTSSAQRIWSVEDVDEYIKNGHAEMENIQTPIQQKQNNSVSNPASASQGNNDAAGQKNAGRIWSVEDVDEYIKNGHMDTAKSEKKNKDAHNTEAGRIWSVEDVDEYIKNGHMEADSSKETGEDGEYGEHGKTMPNTNPTNMMHSVNRVLGSLAGEDKPNLQARAAEDAIKKIQQEKRKQAWEDMSMSADDKIADVEKQLEDLYQSKKVKKKEVGDTGVAGDFGDYEKLARMTEEFAGKSEEEKQAYLEENRQGASDAVSRGKQREGLRDIESQIGELENKRAGYQREKKYQEYADAEDFEKNAIYREEKESSGLKKLLGMDQGQSNTYRAVNILDKYRDKKQEDMTQDEKAEYDRAMLIVLGDPRNNDPGHYISDIFNTNTDAGHTAVQEMSHDQVKMYNYIYNTKGEKEAETYLKDIAEGLNYQAAQKEAEYFKGNPFMEVLGGIETGLDQFKQGGRAIINGIKSDTALPTSEKQYAGAMYREDLAGKGPKILGNSLGQMAYDVANTSANMIPSIVASAAVGGIAPAAGEFVGAGLLGASAGGNTFNEEWKNGVSKSQAAAYGITSGLSEAAMQYALGGISKLGGKEEGSILLGGLDSISKGRVTAVTSKIDDAIGKVLKGDVGKGIYGGAKELGAKMFAEGREEYLQDALDPLFRNITLGEDNDCLGGFVSSDSLYSGLLGAISGGMFAGGEVVSHQIEEKVYMGIGEDVEQDQMEGILAYAESQKEDLKDFTDRYRVDATEVNAGKLVVAAQKHVAEGIMSAGTLEDAYAAYQDILSKHEGNAFVEGTAEEALHQVLQELDIDGRTAENIQGMEDGRSMDAGQQMREESMETDAGLMEEIQPQENPITETHAEDALDIKESAEELLEEDAGRRLAQEAASMSEEDAGRQLAREAVRMSEETEGNLVQEEMSVSRRNTEMQMPGRVSLMPENYVEGIPATDIPMARKNSANVTREYMNEANARKINAMAEGMETDTAKVFRQNWKGSVTPEVYQEVFETVKNAAVNEVPIENIAETTNRPDIYHIRARRIGQEAIQYMYFAGENELARIAEKTMSAEEVDAVDAIAKAFGREVHIMDSISNGRSGANGMYQNGKIYLSRKSTNRARTVLAHETTHMMKESAAGHYQNFEDYVIGNLKEQGEYDSVVEQYRGKVGSDDIAIIHEEIAADTTETFLDNPDKFMEFAKSNTSVAQKLVDIVSDLIEKIKSAIKEYAPESRVAKLLQEEADAYTEARDLWYEGIQELMRQNAERESSFGKDGNVSYSGKSFSEQFDHWDKKNTRQRFVLGKTPSVLKNMGIAGKNIMMDAGKMIKIMHKHPEMTEDAIKQIPSVLKNPMIVMDSVTNPGRPVLLGDVLLKGNKPMLVALELHPTRKGKARENEIVIASAYAKDHAQNLINNSEIQYINEDKNKTRDWLERTGLQLPVGLSQTGLINSISKNQGKGNPKKLGNEKYSLKEIPVTIREDAIANRKDVAEMDAVATVPDTLFAKGEKKLSEQVEEFFAERGNNAYNDVIGDVELSHHGVKSDIAHGMGRVKAITFGAVPEVIEKGKVIDYQKNRKGRGYDTVVIAAPVKIKGKSKLAGDYMTAVVATRKEGIKNQRFYLHEALTIKKEEVSSRNRSLEKGGASSLSGKAPFKTWVGQKDDFPGDTSSDILSLLQKTLNYKWEDTKFSMKDMDGKQLFSAKEDDFAWMDEILSEESSLGETASILEEGMEEMRKSGKEMDEAAVRKISRDILKKTGSVYDLDTFAENLEKVFSYMESTEHVSYEDMVRVMTEVALPVVDEIGSTDEGMQGRYDEMVEYLRKTPIALSESQREEVAGVADNVRNFMSRNADIMKFRKDGVTLDRGTWSELVRESGNILPPDANEAEMPIVLAEFVRGMKPPVEYYGVEGAARENLAYDLALHVFKKYFGEYAANQKVQQALDGKIAGYKKKVKRELEAAVQKERVETEQKLLAERDYLKEQAQDLVRELQQARREQETARELEVQEELDRVNERIREIKAANQEEIARIKAKNRATWIQRGYRKQETELRNKIRKVWSDLQKKVASPTEASYVPEGMIQAVMDVCSSVDVAGGNKAMAQKLSKLRDIYEAIKPDSEKMGKYDDMFDHNLYAQIRELQNKFQSRTLKELSYSELKQVYETMHGVKEQIVNSTKLIGKNKAKEAYQRAQAEIGMIRDVKRGRKAEKALDGLLQGMTKQGLSPMKFKSEMKRLTGYQDGSILVELADDFNKGSIQKKQIEMEVERMFDDVLSNEKEVNRTIGKKERDWIQLEGYVDKFGEPVMIPRSMMLSLAMHMQNKGNAKHVIWGGIRIPDARLYRKGKMAEAYDRGTVLRLVDVAAYADNKVDWSGMEAECRNKILKFCNENMTEHEKKLLTVSKKFFHEYSGEKINGTSLELKGYKIARVKNYFPISTDKNFVKSEVSGLVANGTIEGMGMLKERVSARNPVNLESIFDVIERHTDNVGSYVGYAIPVRNFNKIYNTSMVGYEDSVSNALASVWGEEGKTFIKNFLTDVQGGRTNGQSNFFTKLRGNYAQAILTGNPSVMIKQAASLPTAAATLGWKPIMKALPHFGINLFSEFTSMKKIKTDFEKINKYTPLFWDRTNAAFDSELMDIKKSRTKIKIPLLKQFAEGFLKGIEKVDEATVGSLWYAAEDKVKRENKGLKAGTDTYYEKVAEVFNEAVLNTQPMYDVTQQADISRNPNALVKALFMFKTQPMQNFNILFDATAEFHNKSRLFKEGKCSKDSLKEARNRFMLAVTSQLASAVTFASMTLAAKKLLNREDDDEDILRDMINNTLSSIAGSFVFGSELYEAISKIMTGDKYFGVEVSVISSISDMAENLISLRSAIDGYGDAGTKEEEHAAMRKICQNIHSAVDTSAEIFGIPLGNVKKLSDAVTSRLADWRIEDAYKTDEAKKAAKEAYEVGDVTRETLYQALDNGERTKEQIQGKIREALKDNDLRIEEAAKLHHAGDFSGYKEKVEEVKGDGFRQNEVLQAVESKERELYPEKKEKSPEKSKGIYDVEDLSNALEHGGNVQEIVDEIMETGEKNGMDRSAGIKSAFRDAYKDAYADGDEAERQKIRETISRYRINDTELFDEEDYYRWRLKYSGKDICKVLENGNLEDAQAMIDEMYQVKWEHYTESAKTVDEKAKVRGKSASSMKSSISGVYKKLYQEGDASEKQRIITLLNTLRADGKKLFNQEDYLRWNKEIYN